MFTGLIEETGTVERIGQGAMTEVWIRAAMCRGGLTLGESIACDGACLTVVESNERQFRVQASAETLRRTTLSGWRSGGKVNLERAMKLGDRLGGHLVLGHVDEVAQVVDKRAEGGAVVMSFSLSHTLSPFFIEKGSVAIDGISLTVNEVAKDRFSVSLIPETQVRTTIGGKTMGDRVNIEADLIGKYVARLYGARAGGGLSEATLKLAGFGEKS
ncbi:MAG: riboflavin synthase [Myxococcaceae bacterium]